MEMNALSPESRSTTGSDVSQDPTASPKREYDEDGLYDEEIDLSEDAQLLRHQLRKRKASSHCSPRNALVVLFVGTAGFLLGSIFRRTDSGSGFYSTTRPAATGRCNAYHDYGVLQVNLNVSRENKWISLDSNCTPIGQSSAL